MSVHDRPSAAELVEAVRELLERDVLAATEGRVRFHVRVAVNILGMVERELTAGPQAERALRRRLAALLGHDAPVRVLTGELAARIRDGTLDDRRAEVVDVTRAAVRAKLEVANPRHLGASA